MVESKASFSKYIKALWISTGLVIIGLIVFFWLVSIGKLGFMPSFDELENPKNLVASEIYTADGKLLGKYYKEENRTLVAYDEMSKYLVNALVATEDERYYNHSGIDLKGLVRVVKGVVTNSTSSGGGSTITQQLAKQLFPREDNSGFKFIIRKFREWVIAVKLERSYTKEEIITMYLNKFDFIYNALGIQVASQTYFSTSPDSLQLHQAAMLVGMLKNPHLYNPMRFENRAIARRNVVLGQMLRNRYINREQYDTTKVKPLDLSFNREEIKKGQAYYFRKYLERTLLANKPEKSNYGSSAISQQKYLEDSTRWFTNPLFGWCNKNLKPDGTPYDLHGDGLKIYSTIDSRMQTYGENAVEWNSKRLQPALNDHITTFEHPPFSNNLSENEVNRIVWREISRSARYKKLRNQGLEKGTIEEIFNTPDTLLVYTWDGYRDTIMSPHDSIMYYLKHLSSSFMAMNPVTGEVKAWVGGIHQRFTEIDMVRSSTYKRQVGSTCKPFLYTLAIMNGTSPCQEVPNVPQTFILDDGSTWTAKNSSPSEMDDKVVTLKWGLANSVNQISAWVMKQYNPKSMQDIMKKMGIYSTIPAVPSMFLGTAEITLYEMIAAYSVFANKGVYTSPIVVTKIEDTNGNVLATFKPKRHDAIDEQTAYVMTQLLQTVVREGSGIRLNFNWPPYDEYAGFSAPFAGKTGTTQDQGDGWFIGFTPNLVAGSWTGANYRHIHFEDLRRGQGANMSLPVFGKFFKQVFADSSLNYTQDFVFERPSNLNVELDCGQEREKEQLERPTFDGFY